MGVNTTLAQKKPADVNQLFGIFGEQFIPELHGLNCGTPGTKQNRCCSPKLKKDKVEELQTRAIERIPEFFCLPPGLSQIAQTSGGLLGDLVDAFVKPFEAAINVVQGDFGGALDSLGDFVLPEKTVKALGNSIKGDKVCLSDAPKLMMASTLGILPLNRAANLELPPQPCIEGAVPTKKDYADKSCKCVPDPTGFAQICNQYIRNPGENKACLACVSKRGVWTGVGCIGTDMSGFVSSIMGIGVGVAGGIALLCILYSAILFQTSRGNPETLKKAREYMTNCIVGLLLILFSVFILKIIGVDILGIPGFK